LWRRAAADQPMKRSRGGPRQARQRATLAVDQVLQLLTHGLGVAEVVVALNEAVKQRLLRGSAHQPKFERLDLAEPGAQRRRIDRDRRGSLALGQGIAGPAPLGRQLDQPGAMELQHQAPAHHIAQRPVGLHPVPGRAELL
jgi:hypothetical protein